MPFTQPLAPRRPAGIPEQILAMLTRAGPLADPQFRQDVRTRAMDVPHGISRGMSADFLGAPVDLAAQVMSVPRMLGAPTPDFRQRPFGGSQHIYEMLNRSGLLRDETGTASETAGRVVGGLMTSPKAVDAVMGTAEDVLRYGALGMNEPSPLTVWHGTPHRFKPEPGKPLGGFRSDKIGTGEGNQAKGFGHYVAETPGVATTYKPNNGSLYKADLADAAVTKMLDWDRALSRNPELVSALKNAKHKVIREAIERDWLGRKMYKELGIALGSEKDASEYLMSLGIPGIKYLDANSRLSGKGTRNFVVFQGNEDLLNILERK